MEIFILQHCILLALQIIRIFRTIKKNQIVSNYPRQWDVYMFQCYIRLFLLLNAEIRFLHAIQRGCLQTLIRKFANKINCAGECMSRGHA